MRGGSSRGVFFHADALPADPLLHDRLLLRVIGSPDPYDKHIDGMAGPPPAPARSSSSPNRIAPTPTPTATACSVRLPSTPR
jgi:2-methylaconitate cis-trans-isomerase PrpF